MQPPFPCPVKTWHNDTYPAISPARPELSVNGKTVIITGAGGVIGRETALAYAHAGAKRLALVGRTVASLQETKAALPDAATASIHQADISDADDMGAVARAVGTWDALVLNAGCMPKPGPIAAVGLTDYWSAFETNTKSVIVATQAFAACANKERAVILGVFPGAMCFPSQATAGLSGYLVSKMAQVKLLEYVAAENSHIFTACAHPGMIDSPLFRASGATTDSLPMDTPRLAGHFLLWLASKEAQDLRGKLAWANWDVEELQKVASKLKGSPDFSLGALGWPFTTEGDKM